MKTAAKLGASVGVFALSALGIAQAGDESVSGSGAAFKDLDKNQDGRVSMVESQTQPSLRSSFTRLDRNADGYLTQAEFSGWKMDKAPGTPGRPAPDPEAGATPDSRVQSAPSSESSTSDSGEPSDE